jgi:hypothetical protein
MTAVDNGTSAVLFVSNVLNGTVAAGGSVVNQGTILRIGLTLGGNDQGQQGEDGVPRITSRTVIATGFGEKTDPNALVIGPTGLGLGSNGTLYVADTVGNRIASVPDALNAPGPQTVGTLASGLPLNGPLGLTIAPNGDILTVNGGDGNMVEVMTGGAQTAKLVDTTGIGGGTLFGLAITADQKGVYFVNDGNNTLQLLH